jgi:hypothetical protein
MGTAGRGAVRFAAVVLLLPLSCLAQHPHEREVQRALIELDRRSADFSRVEPHAGQPLHADPEVARQLRPYERMRMAEQREFVLQLPPPVVQETGKPLPLPGRGQGAVDPVTLPGARD